MIRIEAAYKIFSFVLSCLISEQIIGCKSFSHSFCRFNSIWCPFRTNLHPTAITQLSLDQKLKVGGHDLISLERSILSTLHQSLHSLQFTFSTGFCGWYFFFRRLSFVLFCLFFYCFSVFWISGKENFIQQIHSTFFRK